MSRRGHWGRASAPAWASVRPASPDRLDYTFDLGEVRGIVLDTVNRAGGSRGLVTARQVTWLRSLVASPCIRVNGKKSSAIQTTAAKYSRPLANSRPPRIEFVQAKL